MNTKLRKKKVLERSPNVQFYVRFRPTENNDEWKHLIIDQNKKTLFVRALQDLARPVPKGTYWQFNTDGVFCDVPQQVLFSSTLEPLLPQVFEGVDVVVIGFGESSSGKTYTLSGLNQSYNERGLIPRSLKALFRHAESAADSTVKMHISFVEFSENNCYNLLTPKPMKVANHKPKRILNLKNALDLLFYGEARRKFEKISTNCGSAVFTVYIECSTMNQSDPAIYSSKLHFVDLPGIERFYKSDKSLPCAISSNMDKFSIDWTSRWSYYLAKVIAGPSNIANHVVYGSSNLLRYLGRVFTHGSVVLYGFIKPKYADLYLTLSTLRFGCKVARLHCGLLDYHKNLLSSRLTTKLKNEVDELRAQIETSKLLGLGEYQPWNVCQGEAQHIARLVKAYLKSSYSYRVSETCMLSTARPALLLEEFKRQYQAECNFISSNFPLKSISDKHDVDYIEDRLSVAKRGKRSLFKSKKRLTTVSDTASFPVNFSKDLGDDTKSLTPKRSIRKSTTARKSKSSGSRKSIKSKKNKKITKHKKSGVKEEKLPDINEEFLEKGRKDKLWLMNEFLRRNPELAAEKEKLETSLKIIKNSRLSNARKLDELRASLGRAAIQLKSATWKRNYIETVPDGSAAPEINENEKALIEKTKEMSSQINKTCEDLLVSYGEYVSATNEAKAFQIKLDKDFDKFCMELYGVPTEALTAADLDKEIPRATLLPFLPEETESERKFLKLQALYFSRKLPIKPIVHENT